VVEVDFVEDLVTEDAVVAEVVDEDVVVAREERMETRNGSL
jgi:hypothetical protein